MGRSLLAAALLALVAAGCGAGPPPAGTPASPPERPGPGKAATFRSQAALEAARAARLRADIAAARRSRTVDGALRLALLTGRISRATAGRLAREWSAADAAVSRLTGARRAELDSVAGTMRTLASERLLTPGRLAATFLILRRNTEFWTRDPMPAPGFRTRFADDPAVFQYYPGRGLQLQALASWGRANWLAGACLREHPGARRRQPCAGAAELRRTLDALIALRARRAGFLAWESYFAWGGGTPPWISGMTQATAVQALARGAAALQEPRYASVARRALGAFEQPPPVGVSVPAPGGTHYLMYSFAPGLRILNGDLQAVSGLADMAALTGDRTARALFRRGDVAARLAVRGFDTGAWSLYSAQGSESTLGYHQLVGLFLGNLCARTGARVYCAAHARFTRYEHEPPRIGIAPLRGLRARRAVHVRFSLSKLAEVGVRVWSRRGTILREELSLPRGRHDVTWVPPRRGTFRLRIEARGPSGPLGTAERKVRVVRPRPERHDRHRHRHRPAERVDVVGVVGRG